MQRALRLAVLIVASMLALAFAGSALAAYAPKLIVSHQNLRTQGGGASTIAIRSSTADDATARVAIYVPQGYTGVLTAPAGTQIGTVSAHAQALAISADTVLPLTGVIQTADPTAFATDPRNVACTGGGVHGAVWLLVLQASGQTLQVPMYVDVLTAGPEATFAQYRLVVCLPSPYIPVASGGATFGAKVIDATLNLTNIFTLPAATGTYPWRSVWTPYTVGAGTPRPAGTVEARSLVILSAQLTLNAKITNKKKKTVSFSGTLSQGTTQLAGQTINLLVNSRKQFSTRTRAGGKYSFALRKTGKKVSKTTFRAQAVVKERDVTSSQCGTLAPPLAPGGCVSATIGPFTVLSPARTIRL